MPNLPTTRQRRQGNRIARNGRSDAKENLTRAFLSFTQAAGSLERSYAQLQGEVQRLHVELEQANAELEKSLEENKRVRSYLSRVLDHLPCGVVVADHTGTIQVLNPEAKNLLRLDEGIGGVEQLPEEVQALLKSRRADDRSLEQEWRGATDREKRTLSVLRANIGTEAAENYDEIWILRDITEEKKAATEREAARRSLALAEVATVLAHEIRNPLGSMELFTGLLADATAQMPETQQWMTHLQAGLRSLSATVNNVLFSAHPTAERLPTEIDTLLAETLAFLQPLARQRGQKIHLENAMGKIVAQADANRLKQVFLNLSLNAFRAMAPGGTLSVRLSAPPQFPDGAVQIDFKDEGRGLPEELLDRIYEPGFTTTPGSPGLGLAVCKKVIVQHGGEIRVQSKPLHGATFSIILPTTGATA